jgi:predicted metalloendopeptidase
MQKTYNINNYNSGKPSHVDDFYGCVNYEWINNNKIPEDEIKYTNFVHTQLGINNNLKQILESNSFPLATQLYNSYLNMKYRNNFAINDIKQIINTLNGITKRE